MVNNENIKIIKFSKEHANDVSNIIIRNLLEVNVKDYSQIEMEDTAKNFTPERITEIGSAREMYVALYNNKPVGTASIVPSWLKKEGEYYILTVFVLPEFHGRSVGKLLINKVEEYAQNIKAKKLIIPSSITSSEFYVKLGYSYKDNVKVIDEDKHYIMEKYLNIDDK